MNKTIAMMAVVLMALAGLMVANAQETADIMQVARDGSREVDRHQGVDADLEQARISVVTC